jgi:hypothetical protein
VIGDRWGVTDDETSRAYPCDRWVSAPQLQAWRAVTIEAAVDDVWPWVAQIRLAPYSYDWIDNLGRRSPQSLLGLDDPSVGEPFTTAGGVRVGRVLSVDPGHELTGRIAGTVISYILEPQTKTRTRLLMKLVGRNGPFVAPLLSVGDLVMARRQLLNIKGLGERSARRRLSL